MYWSNSNSTTGECKLNAYTREIICDVTEKETIKERTKKETSEKNLDFFG